MFRVCLVLSLAVLGLVTTASAHAASTAMSCGSKYRHHPSSCVVSSDGTSAGTARLSGLRWSGWGKNSAKATGRQSANHREADGSLPRYRTTVQVSGLDFCDGTSYYTQIRFKTSWPDTRARYSEWLSLRTPCS